MKRLLFLTSLMALLFSFHANGQDYKTGIGFRGGLSNGLTIKHFTGQDVALEGILAFRWGGYHITGLYEKHQPAFDTEQLKFYYGAGGHIGMWDSDGNPWFNEGTNHTIVGLDGIIGLEYTFREIPFNISADWKPAFNIIGDTGFWGDEAAISIRFTF
ncbi:MAG TPA: hypothetical protein VJ876_06600 [Bacteroidales bacterium]|nr:hypothetical protein [Bacteroidales bacterium]